MNRSSCSTSFHLPLECSIPPTHPLGGWNWNWNWNGNQHEQWCPVLVLHEHRELTPSQKRRHRRYMDHR